ncbi:MAG TPA: methylenetetrahydrofolate reductase, partial [Jatrophihabitantaceae bacterium]
MSRTVRDALANGRPTFSFEFFPPKSPEDESRLWQTIRQLEPLHP